jgi:hypothetical protein
MIISIISVRSQNCEKWLISFVLSCLSVCPLAQNNLAPIGWIFMKFHIWGFLKNLSKKSSVIKIRQDYQTIYVETYENLPKYINKFLSEWDMFHINL